MPVIGLTGANDAAIADAADALQAMAQAAGVHLVLMLHIDCPIAISALRRSPMGPTEIWRVGEDPHRRAIDTLIDAQIGDGAGMDLDLAGQLARFITHPARPEPTLN